MIGGGGAEGLHTTKRASLATREVATNARRCERMAGRNAMHIRLAAEPKT